MVSRGGKGPLNSRHLRFGCRRALENDRWMFESLSHKQANALGGSKLGAFLWKDAKGGSLGLVLGSA
jgi:hypothetical protein